MEWKTLVRVHLLRKRGVCVTIKIYSFENTERSGNAKSSSKKDNHIINLRVLSDWTKILVVTKEFKTSEGTFHTGLWPHVSCKLLFECQFHYMRFLFWSFQAQLAVVSLLSHSHRFMHVWSRVLWNGKFSAHHSNVPVPRNCLVNELVQY